MKTLCFHCREHRFNPFQGPRIPHAAVQLKKSTNQPNKRNTTKGKHPKKISTLHQILKSFYHDFLWWFHLNFFPVFYDYPFNFDSLFNLGNLTFISDNTRLLEKSPQNSFLANPVAFNSLWLLRIVKMTLFSKLVSMSPVPTLTPYYKWDKEGA